MNKNTTSEKRRQRPMLSMLLLCIVFMIALSFVTHGGEKLADTAQLSERTDLDSIKLELTSDSQLSAEQKDLLLEVEDLMACEGLYIQEQDEGSSGKVYTAEVSFYYLDDIPYCSLVYDNFMGTLADAPVEQTEEEGYLFESSPDGTLGSRTIEVSVLIGEEKMRIQWGGSCDYTLTRSTGSAEELEDKTPAFVDSDTYSIMVETLGMVFNDIPWQLEFAEDEKTLYIYVELGNRKTLVSHSEEMQESWSSVLEQCQQISKSFQESLELSLREGLYDISDAHCSLIIVEALNDNHRYFAQDTLAVIEDGEIEYDVLLESSYPAKGLVLENKNKTGHSDASPVIPATTVVTEHADSLASGQRNALQMAKNYLSIMPFSYTSLIDQLEFEGFSHSEAVNAADHCGADWNEQAVKMAENYLELMPFSYESLVEQLEFEGFTSTQAQYGANQAY